MNRKSIALLLVILVAGVFFISKNQQPSSAPNTPDEEPRIVSTDPSSLENATVLPNQSISVTFNKPLENTAEFRTAIEPKIDYKVELSEDRKTAKFIFIKPLALGSGYTLIIKQGSKFDGKDELSQDQVFHFRTIEYKGV